MSMPLVAQPIPASSTTAGRRYSRVPPLHHHHHHQQHSYPPLPPSSQTQTVPIRQKPSPPNPQFTSSFSPPPLPTSSAAGPSYSYNPSSSSSLASNSGPLQQTGMYSQYLTQNPLPLNRRTPSSGTSNSSHSGQPGVRRSSSNGSTDPTSYVALLRKQKATVWCDRSQAEDPRVAAAIRRAKARAEQEMTAKPGGSRITPPNSHSGSFTSGVAKKIRHHGGTKTTTTFGGGNMAGMGVPLRFSATEADDDEDDVQHEEWSSDAHRRTASGRLSTMDRFSASDLSTGAHSRTPSDLPPITDEKTPMPSVSTNKDYFTGTSNADLSPSHNVPKVETNDDNDDDEPKRRGSVDDRAMTMGGVRLFVANPDLDD